MIPFDVIGAVANGEHRSPRHRDGLPESEMEVHGLRVRIDRHVGTVYEGTAADGKPYRIVQQVPYGYLPGVAGDDGDPYDVYVGAAPAFDRAYVVTQCKASTGHYDEQKVMWGFASATDAESCYRAHTAPSMWGRMGSMPRERFVEQLEAWRANPVGTFRAYTDEDDAEAAEMDALEAALADDDGSEPEDDDAPDSEPGDA